MVDSEGQPVDRPEADKALKRVWQILEKAMEYSTKRSQELSSSASLYDFFKDWCDRAIQCGDMTGREVELVLGMSRMWGAYVGDRVERQSLKFFYLEDYDCFIPSNYQKIFSQIATIPLRKAHIQYDTVMVSVETCTSGLHPVCVTTSSGSKQYFDEIVVTTPLGWLKQHQYSIPQLHPRIASAINSMSFGKLEKILIEFPEAFWESNILDSEDECSDKISFVHWLSPSYATQTNPRSWRLECVSFHAFEASYRRNILLFYTFGECSAHITTSIHKLQGKDRDRWLQSFFEPYYSRLPGYSKVYEPIRFLATEWCNDEFAGNGSYSNFQVGMTDAAHDVEAIRYGMPEQHIYFAGEHTAPFDGLGTVAGAYTSGEKVAQRIIASRQSAEKSTDN
ncbi:MAG: hypothetical protein Q9218_003197 [Villophora microphyllina]